MSDYVNDLVEAMDGKDADGMRGAYAAGARLVTMSPNAFHVAEGVEAIEGRLTEWFASWEEEPRFSFLGTIRDGERTLVEFERTSTYEGEAWVVRQAHVLDVGPAGIREHRIYCSGARKGGPELAALYGAVS